MKKLLAIVVLGLLWCSNLFANNLIGKQLQCGTKNNWMHGNVEYLIFINDKKIRGFYIDSDTLKVRETNYEYRAYAKEIEIEWVTLKHYTISRQTLKTSAGKSCKIIKFNIRETLEKESQQLLNAAQKDNKI
tara:strand:+ start:159 stop:554 length:396 start_codon:yes stop_codon:yes gene_type:complete